jgi:hypothetical protein
MAISRRKHRDTGAHAPASMARGGNWPPALGRGGARWIPVLIAALVIGSQLLVEPIVGLADNGDFVNVSNAFAVFPYEPATPKGYFDYLVQTWARDPARKPEVRLLTSEWLLAGPTILAVVYLIGGQYDLRWAGATHLLIFLAALYWLYPVLAKLPRRPRLVAWALLLLAFCDVSYFSYFNSLYVDTASLLFLLLLATFYLRLVSGAGQARRNALAFLVVTGLFLFSKSQHSLLFVVLAPFVWLDRPLAAALTGRTRKAAVAALTLLGVTCLLYTPPEYKTSAAYNVVFAELLPKAPDPRQVLRDLDLSESLVRFSGMDAFHPQSAMRIPSLWEELSGSLSHRKLALYYFKHPDAARDLIRAALEESALQRPAGFSNFPYSAGKPAGAASDRYAVWSGVKTSLFRGHPRAYGAVIVSLFLAALWIVWSRYRQGMLFTAAVLTAAGIEFFVSALADCRETTRHLFLFQSLVDLIFVFVATHAACLLFRHAERYAATEAGA